MPSELQVIQIAPATSQLGFDYPCDIAVLGEIKATLDARLPPHLGYGSRDSTLSAIADVAALEAKYPSSGKRPSDTLISGRVAPSRSDGTRHHGGLFRGRHRARHGGSPRLSQRSFLAARWRAWVGPCRSGVGIGLATGKHAVCFVGDGGSLFSIHALWTAAKYAIPSIFVCFVNHEYRLLKDLWCNAMGTTIETTQFVGMDFNESECEYARDCRRFRRTQREKSKIFRRLTRSSITRPRVSRTELS